MKNFVKINFILCVSILLSSGKNANAQSSVTLNYTGGPQTWTVPSCVTTATVYMWSGGGGGGGGGYMGGDGDNFMNGGGGGGGACLVTTISTLVPAQVYTVTTGKGGTAGNTSGTNGGTGGTTTFTGGAGTWTVAGGTGGTGQANENDAVTAAGGPGSTTGTGANIVIFSGGNGSTGYNGTTDANGYTGSGGGSGGSGGNGVTPTSGICTGGGTGGIGTYPGGTGGKNADCGTTTDAAGTAGAVPGGGGGSDNNWLGGEAGGAGGNGQVTIVWVIDSASSVVGNVITNLNCYAANNGMASAMVTGGAPSTLMYSWTPSGQSTDTATGLSAGTYTVTVNGVCGLSKTATVTITQPTVLTASASVLNSVSCYGGNNGVAFCSAGGGTTPYTYLWTGGGGTDLTAVGLTAGIYKVTVTDNNGCIAQSSVTITQPNMLVTNTTATANANCGINTGSATSTVGGGTTPYGYSWSNGVSNSTVSGLSGGTYTLTVTDNNGCSATSTTTISATPAVSVSASTAKNIACNGETVGAAEANIIGGTAPFEYLWSNGGGTNFTAAGLSAGTYTITVTDNNGCSNTASTTITQPAAINIITDSTAADNGCSGSAWVIVSGGVSPYNYLWSNGNTTDYISDECRGTYCCTVTDNHGCFKTSCVKVTSVTGVDNIASDAGQITVYPNPTNGQFTIESSVAGSQWLVEVYNVLGKQVYSQSIAHSSLSVVDLSSQPNGIYLYRVMSENGALLSEGKIILQK